jgi:hypothetical protein
MISSISNNISALHLAEKRLSDTAVKIAKGDLSAENMVQAKLDQHDIKAQAKVIKATNELEDEILDILA